MENIKKLEKRYGCDVRRLDEVPKNGIGRIGKSGIDKSYNLEEVMKLAYEIKSNIIVKGGKNAKWYLKNVPKEDIETDIEKKYYRDTSRYTMWIIEWER